MTMRKDRLSEQRKNVTSTMLAELNYKNSFLKQRYESLHWNREKISSLTRKISLIQELSHLLEAKTLPLFRNKNRWSSQKQEQGPAPSLL